MRTPLAPPGERAEVLATHCLLNVYPVITVDTVNEIKTNDVKRTTAFLLVESPLMEKKSTQWVSNGFCCFTGKRSMVSLKALASFSKCCC